MCWLIAFADWQIKALPYIIAISIGSGFTLWGIVFFWKVFWPEHWEDEHTAD